MFIRVVKKQRSKNSKVFYQYSLVQSSRIDGKVKQRTILYLGSDSRMHSRENRNTVLQMLKSKIFGHKELFPLNTSKELEELALFYYEKYLIRYNVDSDSPPAPPSIPPLPEKADFHQVDLNGLAVQQVHSFGAEHLCTQVLEKLELGKCLKGLGMSPLEIQQALISIAARAIFSESEHKTAQILSTNSSLSECLNHDRSISHKQLYAVSDKLLKHKDDIDRFLYHRIKSMFDIQDKLVIFDISNTYFETSKRKSKIAKHGNSKEKRYDCPIVVFTGVINAQGFIRHSRIYQGNTADNITLEDMLNDLNSHASTSEKQTVVIDAGIATEENLELINRHNLKYICVARKRIKNFPAIYQENTVQIYDNTGKNRIRLKVFNPQEQRDTWMVVQSQAKELKENSMSTKLMERFEKELLEIENSLHKKGGTKKIDRVWERIGRAKERNKLVSSRYHITVGQKEGSATQLNFKLKPSKTKEDKNKGIYFLRTDYDNPNEEELWNIYNLIREVESTFRCLKTDLQIRPVHHQLDHRIEGHIYLTLLAYQLVNTIRHMLKEHQITYDWKNIVRILGTYTLQTIILPTDKKKIFLRNASDPIKEVKQIFKATHCNIGKKTKKKFVVYH